MQQNNYTGIRLAFIALLLSVFPYFGSTIQSASRVQESVQTEWVISKKGSEASNLSLASFVELTQHDNVSYFDQRQLYLVFMHDRLVMMQVSNNFRPPDIRSKSVAFTLRMFSADFQVDSYYSQLG